MNRAFPATLVTALAVVCAGASAGDPSDARPGQAHPSIIQNERDLAVSQPAPHEGGGTTTAYPFFADAPQFGIVFRKRALHPGSAIGSHPHDKDEIYYVISGRGEFTLDGVKHAVGPGTAMLTRVGSTHSLQQVGSEDLVIIVNYLKGPDER
ncbi:MAG TPA: cupin domain-containing protein [Steroidobacteraceae bacterium]|nr:cupin domain-containing protein [Steroidobacteraceae bacterium]